MQRKFEESTAGNLPEIWRPVIYSAGRYARNQRNESIKTGITPWNYEKKSFSNHLMHWHWHCRQMKLCIRWIYRRRTWRVRAYLNGQTFSAEGEKGWVNLITVDGYSIGWGKLAGGVMKNHYPKGLRMRFLKMTSGFKNPRTRCRGFCVIIHFC